MPLQIPVESAWGRELARWNTPRNRNVVDSSGDDMRDGNGATTRGMGAVGIEPYPKMLYKAQKNAQGKVLCRDVVAAAEWYADDRAYAAACVSVEHFNKRCECVVHTEDEYRQKIREGWSDTPSEALEKHERLEQDISNAAAEANYAAQRLSKGAQAELAKAGAETHQHVTDVVGIPKATRDRWRKKSTRVVAEPEGR
jgi:cell division septum initiation protein DivIVA